MWQQHLAAGTIPPVIFGGAASFHQRRGGEISQLQWQNQRRNQFWSRGDKGKKGNLQTRISITNGGFNIRIGTVPMVNGRLKYYTADLWAPDDKQSLLISSLNSAYSVRVIRESDGWQAHITTREEVSGEIRNRAPGGMIVGGLDCNTDRLTFALASPQGNLLARRTIWMRNLRDMRSDKASDVVSKALDEGLKWVRERGGGCLSLENLKFAQDHDTNRRFNRSTTKFRSTMVKLALRKALRLGMVVVKINPAYTSVIGKHKYAAAHKMSEHEAAAFVIARRAQGRIERLPKKIVAQLPLLRERLMAEAKDKKRGRYLRWAKKLTNWKDQHHWSLWSIWDKASGFIPT
jgi:IS605 OrfB family transposase